MNSNSIPEAARAPASASTHWTSGLVAAAKNLVLTTFVFGFVLGLIAIAWRFLDLYETSVKATAVHARIEMERHQIWMEEVKQRRQQLGQPLSEEATKDLLKKQINELPATTPSPASVP